MVNLAPLKFAKVWSKHGGPIEQVNTIRLRQVGKLRYQATAHLGGHLNLRKPAVEVFGTADGTGTDDSALIARYKAISEALERWALYFLLQCGEVKKYGLEVDPSSTGMAAYPGLFKRGARVRARREAIERYCLINWWEGNLGAIPLTRNKTDPYLLEIENPISTDRVLLVWQKDRHGLFSYGFGSSSKREGAKVQAIVEMERASSAMGAFLSRNPKFSINDVERIRNWQERRILYFASLEGHTQFQKRLDETVSRSGKRHAVKPLVDRELLGPWTQYATVWRVLYPMGSRAYLDPTKNFFFW